MFDVHVCVVWWTQAICWTATVALKSILHKWDTEWLIIEILPFFNRDSLWNVSSFSFAMPDDTWIARSLNNSFILSDLHKELLNRANETVWREKQHYYSTDNLSAEKCPISTVNVWFIFDLYVLHRFLGHRAAAKSIWLCRCCWFVAFVYLLSGCCC